MSDPVFNIVLEPIDLAASILVYRTDEFEVHDTMIKIKDYSGDTEKIIILPLFNIMRVEIEVEKNDDK